MTIYIRAIALIVLIVVVAILFVAHHKSWISAKTRDAISWTLGIAVALSIIGSFLLPDHGSVLSDASHNTRSVIDEFPAAATYANKSNSVVPEPLIVKKALQLMYGSNVMIFANEKTGQWYANWTATAEQSRDFFHDESPDQVNSHVFMVLPFYANRTDNYLILTASVPGSDDDPTQSWDCHACAPVIGGAVLSMKDNVWELTAKTLDIGNVGEWGRIQEGNLVVIGRDHYAVLFELTYMAQGNIDKAMVIIGQVGDQIKVLLNIATGSNDTDGTCAMSVDDARRAHRKMNYQEWCYDYVSQHYFVSDKNSSYYDLIVSYAGTDYDQNSETIGTKDVSRIEIYRFNGRAYELAKTIKQPPIDPEEFNELLY